MRAGAVLLAFILSAAPVHARTLPARATAGSAAAALERAAAGDTVRLEAGVHRGPLLVTRSVTVRGEPGAVVDGGGQGQVMRVAASGVRIEDLEIRASGRRLLTTDCGVYVARARGVELRRLRLTDVLYGIYAEASADLVVDRCRLRGRVLPLDQGGEGNGIHLWYSEDARLNDNRVEGFLDGVYLSFANRAHVWRNCLQENGRYGLHTMYCQENRLLENLFTRNVAGCAIMFSNHLEVDANDFFQNRGPRTYGLLLRDCSDGDFRMNRLVNNTVAVFMDNSNRNRLRGNLVQDNGWGVLLFSSCAGNEFSSNNFVNNDYPVALDMRRTDNRFDDGRMGNYWSENASYDLNGDGVSDVPYSPVSAFAFLSKQFPDLAILAKSPAVAALSVAERTFPALQPSEALDRFPLSHPAGAGISGAGSAAAPRGARPVWPAVGGYAALTIVGLAGVALGRRPG